MAAELTAEEQEIVSRLARGLRITVKQKAKTLQRTDSQWDALVVDEIVERTLPPWSQDVLDLEREEQYRRYKTEKKLRREQRLLRLSRGNSVASSRAITPPMSVLDMEPIEESKMKGRVAADDDDCSDTSDDVLQDDDDVPLHIRLRSGDLDEQEELDPLTMQRLQAAVQAGHESFRDLLQHTHEGDIVSLLGAFTVARFRNALLKKAEAAAEAATATSIMIAGGLMARDSNGRPKSAPTRSMQSINGVSKTALIDHTHSCSSFPCNTHIRNTLSHHTRLLTEHLL